MIISNIVYNKKEKNFNIFIDSNLDFSIVEDTLVKFNLYKGKDIDENLISSIKKENEKYLASNIAVKYLRNMKTTYEVRTYLLNEKIHPEVIDETISYLKKLHYLDDERFAKLFASDKLKINKYGSKKIKLILEAKGVDKKFINEALLNLDHDLEIKNIIYLGRKKFKQIKDKKNAKNKLINHLLYKGYEYDDIKHSLKEILD
ncbi:MAG: RecX family transcriptional regulator [Peptoniphilaceae bacterium]